MIQKNTMSSNSIWSPKKNSQAEKYIGVALKSLVKSFFAYLCMHDKLL